MKIHSVMNKRVLTISPSDSIRAAAQMMRDGDVGCLPVGDGDKLVGMLTDRDIVVRGVASGAEPGALVSDCLSRELKYCYEDEECEHVARNMADQCVRRLPVVTREKRLVGIVTLANFAQGSTPEAATALLNGIAQPHAVSPAGPAA